MKAPSAMRHLLPCPPCGRQGRPGEGFLAGSNTKEPRGSAPRERDHRGGDHPVPSRTRQLSPPSPRVLQRKAAGGQGVALAEGAFLFARAAAEAGRARGRTGSPRGPLLRLRGMCARAPFRARGHAARGLVLCSGLRFLHAGPFRAWRASCARNLYTFRGNSAHAALFRVLGRVSLE